MKRLRSRSVPVDRPGARSRRGEIEEDETIKHGELAAVEDRKEAGREMRREIGESHETRENERDRPSEEAEGDQRPADKLHCPGEIKQSCRHLVDEGHSGRKGEQLAGAVLE